MKIFLKTLKYLGILILTILVILGLSMVISMNYKKYAVKAEEGAFPGVFSHSDYQTLADSLVGQMSLEEKLEQMYGERPFWGGQKLLWNFLVRDRFPHIYVGRNDRLNIPPWTFSDGPRGAVVGKGNTAFPVAMARAASWDTGLERKVAEAIGKEIRANRANYTGSPCINLLRNPLWGRAQETYGEDPWLLGEFGVAFVEGMQSHNVMACPKHYVLNSIENARQFVNVEIGERAFREVYLPHFRKVLQEGQAASIMSAYNKVRGEYCSQNEYLLTTILREDWGFEGFVSTDWVTGLHDGVEGIRAGLDVEMPFRNHFGDELEQALAKGTVSEDLVDRSVRRILLTRLPYAIREDRFRYDESLKACDEHIQLARVVAEKSMVLLKNDDVLPFSKGEGKKVAVIGRLADVENTGDRGSSYVRAPYVVTPFQGIRNYMESLGNEVVLNDGSDTESAISLAEGADDVIIIAGYTHEDEGEYILFRGDERGQAHEVPGRGTGGDRVDLSLPVPDEKLILALQGVNQNTVVVLVGGSAIQMENWKEGIPAILYSWYAGMEGGNALSRILYGDVNPGGKLPFTIPENEADLPEFNRYGEEIEYGYYHGYTLFDKQNLKAAYPFGYGLSYTTFRYDNLEVITPEVDPDDELKATVEVMNTGDRYGEEVAQLYVGFSNSRLDRPVKLLRGFKKVGLDPGRKERIEFTVDINDLGWYDPKEKAWKIEKMIYEVYVGPSSSGNDLLMDQFLIMD